MSFRNTMRRVMVTISLVGAIVCSSMICGWTQELGDPGFEALDGKTVSHEAVTGEWSIPMGVPYADSIEVKTEASAAHSGKVGLKLQQLANRRFGAVHQMIPQLPAGIYEFKVWAKGEGVLILNTDTLRRLGDLTKEWAEYSLTFEQSKDGPVDLAILAGGRTYRSANAQVDDASLTLASTERKTAWKEQEKARSEYGFVPEYFSAQSAQPGAPAKPAGKFHDEPVVWCEKTVFFDKRYDIINCEDPEPLVRYLGADGFQVLEAAPFGEWMKRATREGAHGTVCVMANGIWPGSVYDTKMKNSSIRKYLEAGGRVVWIANTVFYYMQDDIHPQIFTIGQDGTEEILGVRAGWEQACWAGKGIPSITALGKLWGMADAAGATFGAYPEDVTAVLSGFHSDNAASDLAVNWFKNFNPLYPWSGFISLRAVITTNPTIQESVYRLALYTGKPLEAPAGIAAAMKSTATALLKVILDPPRNRHCFYRGEKIPVRLEAASGTLPGEEVLRLSLVRDGKSFPGGECSRPTKTSPTQVDIPTTDLACGDYQLQVQTINNGRVDVVYKTMISVCPRREDPTFYFAPGGVSAVNPYRQEMMIKDLLAAGMQMGVMTTEGSLRMRDLAIKHDLRFIMRAHGPAPRGSNDPEWAESLARGPNGEFIPHWGGPSTLGLLSTKRRNMDAEDMAKQLKELSAWPNCWHRCETCDDFGTDYGWDYSDLAKRLFKEKTGLEAPVPPELSKLKAQFRGCGQINRPKGVVPDNDSWLQWTIFATKDIVGGYNKTLTEACVKAIPDLQIGPIPNPMHIPPWVWGQYPPHSFGTDGFNRLSYYYYLGYWQPLIANLYSDEILRMNNRGLELAIMPDCCYQNEATYTRNTFFLHMAGGCQELNYYAYSEAKPEAWKELARLGNAIVRPLYPFLGKLRPVQAENGLLLSYTQFAHIPLYPTHAVYAYANLLGTHIDVQPTCEEEVLSGYIKNYKSLLLWHVEWLRESVVKALEDYIAKGGVVLADSTTSVPIRGVIKLPVDLAMGDAKSKPDVNDPRLGGPGIMDYLHPDRVSDICKAIAPYVQPWADCDEPTLIVRRHAYRGVTYLWLVNIHNQEEYEYVRARGLGAVHLTELEREKARQEAHQYLAERAQGKRFTPCVTLPAGNWVAYDILKGQRVPLEKTGNRLAFTADMERLGGMLIALYPEPVKRVVCALGPQVPRGRRTNLSVTVVGTSGKPLAGTQPLAVTVLTPKGEWVEVTGAHATEDGIWSTTFHPAVNDPPGTWRIRVKELSSGVTNETSFKVK